MARAAVKQQVVKNAQRLRAAEGFIAVGSLLFFIFRLALDYENTSGNPRGLIVVAFHKLLFCVLVLISKTRRGEGKEERERISIASILRARQDMDVFYSCGRE